MNLKKLKSNFYAVASKVSGEIYCVVKSEAYGCGLKRTSAVLARCGANGFVVAEVAEGEAIRREGINLPVLVLGYTPPSLMGKVLRFGLTQSVFDEKYLSDLAQYLQKKTTVNKLKIWLKVNCGFNRVGFCKKNWQKALDFCQSHHSLFEVEGIFAHFRDFCDGVKNRLYVEKFEDFCRQAQARPFFDGVKISLCNSAGLAQGLPVFDVARIGASLYGIGGEAEGGVVAEYFGRVLQVNRLKKGQSVGYDDSFVAQKECLVGVLDVGYADGLPRCAQEMGMVAYVEGELCPFVGSVCMNHSFVLLKSAVKPYCLAEIFGNHVTAKSLAERLNSVDYEVLCRFGKNAKKIYCQ